jgi:hypothetical protein
MGNEIDSMPEKQITLQKQLCVFDFAHNKALASAIPS